MSMASRGFRLHFYLALVTAFVAASLVVVLRAPAARADDCGHDVWVKGTMISSSFTEAESRQEALFWSTGDPGNCWGNGAWGMDPDPNQSDSYCYSNPFIDSTNTNYGGYDIPQNGPDAVQLNSYCDFSWTDSGSSSGSFNIYTNIDAGSGGWAGVCSYDGFIPDGAGLNCDAQGN